MEPGILRIRLAVVPLLLLALNLAGGNLGPLSPATCRAAAAGLLLLVWAMALAARAVRPGRSMPAPPALVSGLVSFAVLLLVDDRVIWVGGLALSAYGLVRLLSDRDAEAALSARALSHTALVYLLALLLLRHVPLAWNALQWSSETLSGTLGRFFGTSTSQGPSTGGVYVFLTLFAYLGARFLVGARRAWVPFSSGALILAILFAAQMGAGPWLAVRLTQSALPLLSAAPQGTSAAGIPDALAAMYSPVLLLAAGMFIVLLLEPLWLGCTRDQIEASLTGGQEPRDLRAADAGRPWFALLAGAGTALACTALLWGQFPGMRPAGDAARILFYRDGSDTLRQFSVPDFRSFGTANAGMFGLLPRYLEAWGYAPAHMDPKTGGLTREALTGSDVLVIINPDRVFTETELQAVWRYVEAGGSLLVLGDHTDIAGTMVQLNRLLAPVDIRFNFDSAFTATHWVNVIDALPHPVTIGLDHANQRLQHSTGASLSIGSRVRPVVSARWAFSDAGERANHENAFLGDYAWQFDEPIADRVIIAEATYGAGKVLVFGDTSAFQNGGLPHAHAFIERVFRHLSRARRPLLWPGVAGGGLLIGIWLLGLGRSGRGSVPVLAMLPGLAVIWVWPHVGSMSREAIPTAGPVACIDAVHVNRFSLSFWKDDSINGLAQNFSRNGYLPMVLSDPDRFERFRQAAVLTVVAPARAYTPRELEAVRGFMESGGLLVLSVGYEERSASQGLLALAGFDISPVPLGPVPIEPPQRGSAALAEIMRAPHFRKAWPLINTGSSPAEVLYRQGVYDIMAFRPIGKGGALVIADPWFLYDKTLEAEKAWWPGNIELLRSLFATLRSRGVGAR